MNEAFGPAFLGWFRAATEAAWARVVTPTLADFERARVGGAGWQRGTRWTKGLSAGEIAAAEREHGVVFPPDLRLFLAVLGATDRPMIGAGFRGDHLVETATPGFYDWRRDGDAIRNARTCVVEGLAFDIEHNALWLEGWGPRPATEGERAAILRRAVDAAPPLLPVFGHRFLIGAPVVAGNPVLSVVQSDIIVYGGDLRAFLLAEFAPLLELSDAQALCTDEDSERAAAVPFWGELVS